MDATTDLVVRQTEKEITFVQLLDAPRKLVFEAFSSAEHLRQWWMPAPCEMVSCDLDFRPGGAWHYTVEVPGVGTHYAEATYEEIVPNEKIVMVDHLVDADGKPVPNLPSKRVEITFNGSEGQTELVVHVLLQSALEKQQLIDVGFMPGFTTALQQLAVLLKAGR